MNPSDNSRVKILLTNSTVVEGTVKKWFGESIVLQSLNDDSTMIIINPQQNVMLVKVYSESASEEPDYENKTEEPMTTFVEEPQTQLQLEFEEVLDQPSDDPIRNKTLAHLRTLMAEEDRQIIANKLKSHHIGDAKRVQYEQPNFIKKA